MKLGWQIIKRLQLVDMWILISISTIFTLIGKFLTFLFRGMCHISQVKKSIEALFWISFFFVTEARKIEEFIYLCDYEISASK